MAAEAITENQVNYVVWRYLQESGFDEAAVKLQRDWNVDPQRLPFADFVKTHALVTLLHKGLQYCELERLVENGPSRPLWDSIFGPPPPRPELSVNGDARPNGAVEDVDTMQIDSGALETSIPSPPAPPAPVLAAPAAPLPPPLSLPPPPPPPPLTEGASVSTQVEVTLDLTPRTEVLHTKGSNVMHCIWNPVDPFCLATAGTKAPVRIWNMEAPGGTGQTLPMSDASSLEIELLTEDGRPWVASAMCWNPSGAYLALAVYNDLRLFQNRMVLWEKSGRYLAGFQLSMLVVSLEWNPRGTILLGVCSDGQQNAIKLWDPGSGDMLGMVSEAASPVALVSWVGSREFVAAGSRMLSLHRCERGSIQLVRRHAIPPDRELALLRPDLLMRRVATARVGTAIEIWNEHGRVQILDEHAGPITALEWQPMLASTASGDGAPVDDGRPRYLASGSEDGTVRIWAEKEKKKHGWQCVATLALGLARVPVAAIAFSPNGSHLAVGGQGKVLVWHMRAEADTVAAAPGAWWEQRAGGRYEQTNGHAGSDEPSGRKQHEEGERGSVDPAAVVAAGISGEATEATAASNGDTAHADDGGPDEGAGEEEDEEDVPPDCLGWNADGSLLVYAKFQQVSYYRGPNSVRQQLDLPLRGPPRAWRRRRRSDGSG
ncbi:MAG: hypothetical protein M1826_007513 [Phylliscum demangeonii]|nr:MAG: hypothetical protein M1826_007513 [Phylliscum demangeonii]